MGEERQIQVSAIEIVTESIEAKGRENWDGISHNCTMYGQILWLFTKTVFSGIIFIDDFGKTGFITRGKTVSRLVELEKCEEMEKNGYNFDEIWLEKEEF